MPIYNRLGKHKLLLDTHVWIWLMSGAENLSPAFRNAIEKASQSEHILISAISVWEIGMLVAKKRIELDRDCLDWVEESLSSPGFNLVPLTSSIAIQSTRLSQDFHGEPADRILVATAIETHAILVTHD